MLEETKGRMPEQCETCHWRDGRVPDGWACEFWAEVPPGECQDWAARMASNKDRG